MKKLSATIAIAWLVLSGCSLADVVTPTPLPTIAPTSGADVEIIAVQALADIAKDSTSSDRNEAHPSPTPVPTITPVPMSKEERVAGRVAWPLSLATVAVCILSLAVIGGLIWDTRDRRKAELTRQQMAVNVATGQIPELKAVFELLIAYQQGANVPPRNKGENENGE